MSEGPAAKHRFRLDLIAATVVQIALALVFVIVPFGFDHAPQGGLDLNFAIAFALAYFIIGIYGLSASWLNRRWGFIVAQLVVLLILVVSMIY